MPKRNTNSNIPGSIYKNKNRWWWKVRLPGEEKVKARPLKPIGSSMATTDYSVAIECAKMILAQSMLKSPEKFAGTVDSVGKLVKTYLDYVDEYYRDPSGKKTKEVLNIRYSIRPLIELFATVGLENFGPIMLIDVREQMIAERIVRKTINQRIGRIKRMFKWAVTRQYISPVIYQGLSAVEGLKRGRSNAKEGRKVKPVDEKYVYMILDYTTPVIAAMVELQLITGMRPGEITQIKPRDIDRSGEIWHYYPERHKNEFRDHERIVSIGPRGQEILTPFLLRHENQYCFSPAESEKHRKDLLTLKRKTPLSCGNKKGTNKKEEPQKQPGEHYDSDSYRKAVQAAIRACRKDIAKKGGNPDIELPKWTPYQLRHTAATKTRKLFNYETAGALLGHSKMSATAIYAERNQGLADQVAKKFG